MGLGKVHGGDVKRIRAGGFEYRADSRGWDFSAAKFCALLEDGKIAAVPNWLRSSNGAAVIVLTAIRCNAAGPRKAIGPIHWVWPAAEDLLPV